MYLNLVSPTTGLAGAVISSPPNANQTNAWRLANSLANAVTSCVRESSTCDKLFNSMKSINGSKPHNTLQALQNLAHNPSQEIKEIFTLGNSNAVYTPFLESEPDAWTIAIKFNQTGSTACPFGGPGNIAFDVKGNAWITNNVVQGTTNSSNCIIVLKSNGSPLSPIFGGGILGQGFGITKDSRNQMWSGNFGWGDLIPNGSVSLFSQNGTALSGESGYSKYIYRAQAIREDSKGNIWIASNGNQRLVIFPAGKPSQAFFESVNTPHPFDIAITHNDEAWVSFSSLEPESTKPGVVTKYKLTKDNKIQEILSVNVASTPYGMTLDSKNNLWVSSLNESVISMVSSDGNHVQRFSGGGIVGTWNATVDGDDNIYVVNFYPNKNGVFGIAKLCGSKLHNCPPNAKIGTPISPSTGYTLPTGGDQVLLADGTPLYGHGTKPNYQPLMRMVAAKIDKAGNIWVTNNWKPDLDIDLSSNPGGDGVVVFVGLATPPST